LAENTFVALRHCQRILVEMASSATDACTAHGVLADVYLFHHIISFQRGIPGRIVHLERQFPTRVDATGSLAKLAVECNDLRAFQDLLQIGIDFPWYRSMRKMDLSEAMHVAARHGRLEILQWCHAHTSLECLPWTFAAAARCGQLHVLPWLQTHRPESMAKFEPFSMDRVAEEGRVDVFQWLEQHVGTPCTTSAMDSAALNGHLDMIRYLHTHRNEGATPLAMDMAALKGHVHVLRFLHEHRSEGCTTWAMDSAAAYGRLDVVQFLHENRTEGCTVKAMNEAAARGNMAMVQYLHTHRREGCNKYAIRGAARFGHLDMVRFLHETFHSQHCSRDTMVAAAEGGRLDVVRYLNDHCDASSGNAIVFAALNGHGNVVKYLVENRQDGCLVAARDKAKKGGFRDVVAYLETVIVPGLTTCVSTNHDRKDAARVCQRPETVGAA
jgi:hypothetical protein